LCFTDKNLEGRTDSGDGLSTALEANGMCLGPAGEAMDLERAFVWRNIREDCLRKDDVSRIAIDSSIWTIGAWLVSS